MSLVCVSLDRHQLLFLLLATVGLASLVNSGSLPKSDVEPAMANVEMRVVSLPQSVAHSHRQEETVLMRQMGGRKAGKGGKKGGAKQKGKKQEPNPICPGSSGASKGAGGGISNSYQIVGSVFLNGDGFVLFVYDATKKEHLLYTLPVAIMAPYLAFGTISLANAHCSTMNSLMGYDPMKKKQQRIIDTVLVSQPPEKEMAETFGGNATGPVYFLHYDPAKSRFIEALVLEPKTKVQTVALADEVDFKQSYILDSDKRGLYLSECKEFQSWCAAEVEWTNEELWRNRALPVIKLGEMPGTEGNNHVYLFMVPAPEAFPAGVGPVTWKKVSGFISMQTTVLFTDTGVYHYDDHLHGIGRGLGLITGPYLNYSSLKVPTEEYFSCDGQIFTDRLRVRGVSPEESNAAGGRAMWIYTLFGMHFLVALVMIVIIVVYTIRNKSDDDVGGANSGGQKRVRKGPRTSPVKGSKSKSKSRSSGGASKSAKSQRSAGAASKTQMERSQSGSSAGRSASKASSQVAVNSTSSQLAVK